MRNEPLALKRRLLVAGLVVGGLLLLWLTVPVVHLTTVRIEYLGQASTLPANALEIEAEAIRSEMIRSRVIGSFSDAEKTLLRADVNSVSSPIVHLNRSDSTLVVAIIDPRAEVAGSLADRYTSEYFRLLRTTNGRMEPEEVKQTLRELQARLRQEIETAKTASETHRQSRVNDAAVELEKRWRPRKSSTVKLKPGWPR